MAFTGIIDVDKQIILFCDFDVISKLLTKDMKILLSDMINDLVEINKNNPQEIVHFVYELINRQDLLLAKKLIVSCENKINNFYKIMLEEHNEDVLEIYFNLDDYDCKNIYQYFKECVGDKYGPYQDYNEELIITYFTVAIKCKNEKMLYLLMDYWDLENYSSEEDSEEIADPWDSYRSPDSIKMEINILYRKAKEIVDY